MSQGAPGRETPAGLVRQVIDALRGSPGLLVVVLFIVAVLLMVREVGQDTRALMTALVNDNGAMMKALVEDNRALIQRCVAK